LNLGEKTNYQISPDGTYLSFLAPYHNRLNIFVQKRGTGKATRITSVIDRDIRNYVWKNNNQLVYFRATNGDENAHLFSVDRQGQIVRDLTPFAGVRIKLADELKDDNQEMLIGMNKRDKKVFDIYRINVISGDMKMVLQNPGNIVDVLADHTGNVRVAIATEGTYRSVLYRDTESVPFKKLLTTNFKDDFSPVLFSFDNKFLYALSNVNRDKKALVAYDPQNMKETAVLFEHSEFDAGGLSHSRKRKVVTAASYTSWKKERFFLDDQFQKMVERLEKMLSGYEVIIADHTKNEDLFIVRTYSDRSLGAYYLYDTTNNTLTKLADISPWLPEDKLAPMKPITYTSRDGLTIHGYLTVPNGVTPKNISVVVNPHGGPWARDSWGYNPEVQFLANRGYAVFQVNFRGSTGYGKNFWQRSFKQWGKTMQDDVSDGVAWLIEQDIADPKRIAIYGGSYGGYATLAGLAFTPDLYACGVDYVGVSNLFTFLKTIPAYWKLELEILYAQVSNPEKDKKLFEEESPVFHVDKIKAPLFIAQGRNDPRVNINESDQMVAALKNVVSPFNIW
jgi:dipeptidyl aminopeptidase/acylaminoacyl peptidase